MPRPSPRHHQWSAVSVKAKTNEGTGRRPAEGGDRRPRGSADSRQREAGASPVSDQLPVGTELASDQPPATATGVCQRRAARASAKCSGHELVPRPVPPGISTSATRAPPCSIGSWRAARWTVHPANRRHRRERSTRHPRPACIEDLQWLGLEGDEGPDIGGDRGPYRQSERLELYHEHARDLINAGKALFCFCTPEQIAQERAEARARGEQPRYSRRCTSIAPADAAARVARGEPAAIRFSVPAGPDVEFDDLVRGRRPVLAR